LFSQAAGVWVCLDVVARLGRRSVVQGRILVAVVVLVLKWPMTARASNRLFQWLRLRVKSTGVVYDVVV
jgi:hypothetical protein